MAGTYKPTRMKRSTCTGSSNCRSEKKARVDTPSISIQKELKTFEHLRHKLGINESDSIIVTGPDNGHPIVYVTKGWEEMCGWKLKECIGKSGGINQGPDTSKQVLGVMGASLKQGKPIKAQLINYRESGEPFWNLLNVHPVKENGETVLFVAQLQDYTHRMAKLKAVTPFQFVEEVDVSRAHSFLDDTGVDCTSDDSTTDEEHLLPVELLGFKFPPVYDFEYVYQRLLDVALVDGFKIENAKKFSFDAVKSEDSLEFRVSISRCTRGGGSFYTHRICGDIFCFKTFFRHIKNAMEDVIVVEESSPSELSPEPFSVGSDTSVRT
jgi:PAS domain S-box-containing protein